MGEKRQYLSADYFSNRCAPMPAYSRSLYPTLSKTNHHQHALQPVSRRPHCHAGISHSRLSRLRSSLLRLSINDTISARPRARRRHRVWSQRSSQRQEHQWETRWWAWVSICTFCNAINPHSLLSNPSRHCDILTSHPGSNQPTWIWRKPFSLRSRGSRSRLWGMFL